MVMVGPGKLVVVPRVFQNFHYPYNISIKIFPVELEYIYMSLRPSAYSRHVSASDSKVESTSIVSRDPQGVEIIDVDSIETSHNPCGMGSVHLIEAPHCCCVGSSYKTFRTDTDRSGLQLLSFKSHNQDSRVPRIPETALGSSTFLVRHYGTANSICLTSR